MNIDLLIKMANEISAFFAGESGPGQAPQEVASHMKKFWEKRMREQIVAHSKAGAAGLSDIAKSAVGILAEDQRSADIKGA